VLSTQHRRLLYAGVVIRSVAIIGCAVLCLTACGAMKQKVVSLTPTTTKCASVKADAKLRADIAAMHRAAQLPTKNTLLGDPAINHATDRFLNDVEVLHVSNLDRNRMIDHAIGTLGGTCEQCFQALEAARPIPNLRNDVVC
jgi:hypothetical protein